MKRALQLFALMVALAVLAPVARAQIRYYELKYKNNSVVGTIKSDGDTFVSCEGQEIILSDYPELRPTRIGSGCIGLDSADEDAKEAVRAEERKLIRKMLDEYRRDHPDDN